MLDDQIFNMKMEVKLGQLIKDLLPIMKNISKILFEDARTTSTKCVYSWYTPQE